MGIKANLMRYRSSRTSRHTDVSSVDNKFAEEFTIHVNILIKYCTKEIKIAKFQIL